MFQCLGLVVVVILELSPDSGPKTLAQATPLLLWNSGPVEHVMPFVDIGLEPGRDFLRRTRSCLDAKLDQPSLNLSVGEYILQCAIERLHDLRRGAGGRKQRIPGDDVVIGDAALSNGSNIPRAFRAHPTRRPPRPAFLPPHHPPPPAVPLDP